MFYSVQLLCKKGTFAAIWYCWPESVSCFCFFGARAPRMYAACTRAQSHAMRKTPASFICPNESGSARTRSWVTRTCALLAPFFLSDPSDAFFARAAGTNARKLSKKLVERQDIKRLCDGLQNPVAALALRLRAVLLRGIALVHQRQIGYLLKDARDAWQALQDSSAASASSTSHSINLPGTGVGRNITLASAGIALSTDAAAELFFIGEQEATRGARGASAVTEVLLLPPVSMHTSQRADITLAPDQSIDGGGAGASGFFLDHGNAPGGDFGLLDGGFGNHDDFLFGPGGDMEIALEPTQPDAQVRALNPLLDALAPLGAADGRRGARATTMALDPGTRMSSKELRKWLEDDSALRVARPQLVSAHPLPEPCVFAIGPVAPELAHWYGNLEEDMDESAWRSATSGSRAASVEQARNQDALAVVEDPFMFDPNWDALPAGDAELRFSDPRLPSMSPLGSGRKRSRESSAAGGGIEAVEHYALAQQPLQTPQASPGAAGVDQVDQRTYLLKGLLRSAFVELEERGVAEPWLSFDALTSASARSKTTVARTFYHVLLLASTGHVVCAQERGYGDIVIQKTELF